MNAMCQQCHTGGPLLHWLGSLHESRGLACSDCHNPMAKTSAQSLLRAEDVNRTCLTCHPAQRTDFRKRSHMPLFEGKIDCTDCHAPRGSPVDPLIKADSVNELCTSCHAEKRGPFLWEHAPVRESWFSSQPLRWKYIPNTIPTIKARLGVGIWELGFGF